MTEGAVTKFVVIYFPVDALSRERSFDTVAEAMSFAEARLDTAPMVVERTTHTTENLVWNSQ